LAIWQTEWVQSRLHSAGYLTERIEIKTTGDLAPNVPLSQIGARALFTKQIDDALLDRRIDLAVHSCKDLPTELPAGLAIAAIGQREDPRDALVGRGSLRWTDLPRDAVVATSSLRRKAQILSLRPDLTVVDVRGNVETRVAKLDRSSDWAAMLLATAGLVRLGLEQRIGERLPPELMLPAPGQGSIAVTVRDDDSPTQAAARAAVHHRPSALIVAAERGFLRRLEGGCQVPVGAFAQLREGGESSLYLQGRVLSLTGERKVEGQIEGSAADEASADALGVSLANRLLEQGAGEILGEIRTAVAPPVPEP
jgi:hydroxymethylbilane synthase